MADEYPIQPRMRCQLVAVTLVTLALSLLPLSPSLARGGGGGGSGSGGGHYVGGQGSSHLGGKYVNPDTGDHYRTRSADGSKPNGSVPNEPTASTVYDDPGAINLCPPPHRMTRLDGCQ
jgi:hypothetical protein